MVSFKFLLQRNRNTTEKVRPRALIYYTPTVFLFDCPLWLCLEIHTVLCLICSKEHTIFGMGASRHVAWTLLYFDQSVMCCTLAWPQERTILTVSLNLYLTVRLQVSHVSFEDEKLQYLLTERFVNVEQPPYWVLLPILPNKTCNKTNVWH